MENKFYRAFAGFFGFIVDRGWIAIAVVGVATAVLVRRADFESRSDEEHLLLAKSELRLWSEVEALRRDVDELKRGWRIDIVTNRCIFPLEDDPPQNWELTPLETIRLEPPPARETAN